MGCPYPKESRASCNEQFTYGEAQKAWTERSGVKAERVVASNFTYGEAEMAWTERSEVKMDGFVGDERGLDFFGGVWKWGVRPGNVKMRRLTPLRPFY